MPSASKRSLTAVTYSPRVATKSAREGLAIQKRDWRPIEEAEAHDGIMDDPKPSVRLTELGGSSVGLQSRFWIAEPSRAEVVTTRGEYVTAVKERFDEEGIDLPYPHRTLTGGIEFAGGPVAADADGETAAAED